MKRPMSERCVVKQPSPWPERFVRSSASRGLRAQETPPCALSKYLHQMSSDDSHHIMFLQALAGMVSLRVCHVWDGFIVLEMYVSQLL